MLKANRVRRKVQRAVGKGAAERVIETRRTRIAPKQLEEDIRAPAPRKPRAPPIAVVRTKKGALKRVVESVFHHRFDKKGKLEFKVKWSHLTAAENLALPYEPIDNFIEVINGVKYYNPVIDKYMEKHELED